MVRGGMGSSARTVSYTHLDVYKRQVVHSLVFIVLSNFYSMGVADNGYSSSI